MSIYDMDGHCFIENVPLSNFALAYENELRGTRCTIDVSMVILDSTIMSTIDRAIGFRAFNTGLGVPVPYRKLVVDVGGTSITYGNCIAISYHTIAEFSQSQIRMTWQCFTFHEDAVKQKPITVHPKLKWQEVGF